MTNFENGITKAGTRLTATPHVAAHLFATGQLLVNVRVEGQLWVGVSVWDVIADIDEFKFPLVLDEHEIDRRTLLETAACAVRWRRESLVSNYLGAMDEIDVAEGFASAGYLEAAVLLGWDESEEVREWAREFNDGKE